MRKVHATFNTSVVALGSEVVLIDLGRVSTRTRGWFFGLAIEGSIFPYIFM